MIKPGDGQPLFCIIVLADLAGQPVAPLPKLKDRRLVRVTRESYPLLMHANPDPDHRLRATWSGLRWLLEASAELDNVIVKVLNVSKKVLLKDLQRAPEFDQSALFKKVYEEALGTFGGDPAGLILADIFLGTHPEDIELGRKMAQVAAAAFAPLLIGVAPDLFTLPRREDLANYLDPFWFQHPQWEGPGCEYLMPLLPKWCMGAPAEREWLHPGYLVAAAIARAMHPQDLAAVATNLFPGWGSAGHSSTEDPAPLLDTDRKSGVELEWHCTEDLRTTLAQRGLYALSFPGPKRVNPAGSLAKALLRCYVAKSMYVHARQVKRSDSADPLIEAIEHWAADALPADEATCSLLSLSRIRAGSAAVVIPLSWHPGVGGGSEQIVLRYRLEHAPAVRSTAAGPLPTLPRIVVMGSFGSVVRFHPDCQIATCIPDDRRLPFQMQRSVTVTAPDRLTPDGVLKVQFLPTEWSDFEPASLCKRVPALWELSELRKALAELGLYRHFYQQSPADPDKLILHPTSTEGWETAEIERFAAKLQHSFSAHRKWAARTEELAGLDLLDQLRRQMENIDRITCLQLRDLCQSRFFRAYRNLCLATKWLTGTVQLAASVVAFGYDENLWDEIRNDGRLRNEVRRKLAELWTPSLPGVPTIVIDPGFQPEVLDASEKLTPGARIMIVPWDTAGPPLDRAENTTLIFVSGHFLLQPARRLPGSGETVEEDLYASAAYPVAVAAARAARGTHRLDCAALSPALQEFGLTCRPLDDAILVTSPA